MTTSPAPQIPAEKPSPAKKRRRWLVRAAVIPLTLLVGIELILRLGFGLGNPPLLMTDPAIEYLFQPNQTLHRFGNLIHYNAYSQRSDDYSTHKSDPRQLRILMIGDSVINGGAQTDQANLASSIIQRELSAKLSRKVIVGNASAASWGPPNMLAYLKKFGLFDADVLVIVLSSHDAIDVPTFGPSVGVHPSMPDHKRLCAFSQPFSRYLVPRLRGGSAAPGDAPPPADQPPDPRAVEVCMKALREMIEMGRASGARVIVVQHLERQEVEQDKRLPGHDIIQSEATRDGVEVLQLGPAFIASFKSGHDPIRANDGIHPNDVGQRLLANLVEEAILQHQSSTTHTAAPQSDRGEMLSTPGSNRK